MTEPGGTDAQVLRLEQIAHELSGRDGALALLGLGSVGNDTDRLDEYSDLDFFVIVEPGQKDRFVENLDWLASVSPIGFVFQNTADGHKALFSDGLFCELAVFEPSELTGIPFERGRVVWKRDEFDSDLLEPSPGQPGFGEGDEEFLLGELLTNLYVGLGRFARGETLSACFFVQHHAVVRLLDLLELWEGGGADSKDSFSNERRAERRFPQHAGLLSSITPGSQHTPAAAARMLDFLAARVSLNEQLEREIRQLIDRAES